MIGLPSKIDYGRPIIWKSVVGQILAFARFAKQTTESRDHIFIHCRFTIRIWELLKDCLGLQVFHPRNWMNLNIKDWLVLLVDRTTSQCKALATLSLLTVWELWN
jgi:hypothetical protein